MSDLKLSKRLIKKFIYLLLSLVAIVFGYFFKNNSLSISDTFQKLTNVANISTNTNSTISNSNFKPDSSNIYFIGNFTVNYITDGDTFHVVDDAGKTTIVRVLVVNTPEIHKDTQRNICLGNISKNFTKINLLNKKVELWADSTQPKLDKYGRTLAYVRIVDSTSPTASTTQFFNDTLMQTGMAKIYKSNPPGTYFQKYLNYQTEAQKQNLGMWNLQTCN